MYYKQVFLWVNAMQSENHTTLDLLEFINQFQDWQIHRCGLIQGFISQDEPVKLVYHYEQLSDEQKQQYPLQGELLKQFDQKMDRQQFANLLNININKIKKPYQMKFYGKLVIFCQNPELALRLYWTNTLKAFEMIDDKDLQTALQNAFLHWQFVDDVEFINKNPQVQFIVQGQEGILWQNQQNQQFEKLPAWLAIDLQKSFMQSDMSSLWFEQIYQSCLDFLTDWQEKMLK